MNKIIEKIIMGLFYIICFLSFGITVIELPNVLNEWFNTLRFSGSSFVILIILLVLLYYVYNRHITIENNKETENRRELSDNINFVNYLNEYDYKKLKVIQKAYYEGYHNFSLLIKGKTIKLESTFIQKSFITNLDLKELDECLQNYEGKLENTLVSIYINNNYIKKIQS